MSSAAQPSFGNKGTIKFASAPVADICNWTLTDGRAEDGFRLGSFTIFKMIGFPGETDERSYPKPGGQVFEADIKLVDDDDSNLVWTARIELVLPPEPLGQSIPRDGIRWKFKLAGELQRGSSE